MVTGAPERVPFDSAHLPDMTHIVYRRGNAYGAAFVKAEATGTDGHGYTKYRVTYSISPDGIEVSANTRGYLRPEISACCAGDIIDVIRDGRGSIIDVQNKTRGDAR